ncbi:serine hydrolase [Maribacter sp.]|nr:serine hydrolase [Maribacter sp.]
MNNQTLAERLVYHRKIKGFSQEKLSHETNVTVRTIQRIEKAEVVTPHLNTIKLLAVALEIEVDQLLPLQNPKEETIKKKWLLLLHATPLLGVFIPLCNVLIPLLLWIHKRDDNPIYNTHGIKVINFQITALLLAIFSFVSLVTIEKWGFFIFILTVPICILIVIFNVILVVQKGKCYYPLAIPFLSIKSDTASKTSLLALLLITFGCATGHAQTVARLDGSIVQKDSLTKKINQLTAAANVQGMAVAIFNNKLPVYQNISGYKDFSKKIVLTDTTSIYGASLSKAVFSILTMKLVEDNIIDLDTPLESYLPKKIYEYEPQTRWHDDYADLKQDDLYQKITARMCLAHTTGFANWRFMEPDRKLKVNSSPGTKYSYSGEGFVYLQVVLEKITGKGLEELAQELIFKPLQMKNSSYEWQARFGKDFAYGHMENGETYEKDTDNEPRGGSTLETTASDYIKFLSAILNQELLTKASYEEIFSPQIRIQSLRNFGPDAKFTTNKYDAIDLSYGLGWVYLKTPYGKAVSKGGHGDGFQHYSILFPESGIGILIMTNSDNGERIYKELLEYAIADTYTPWEWSNYRPYNW